MMVKNEQAVIGRAIRSALPYIDSAIIVDTGSTDNTLDIVQDLLSGVPNCIILHNWKDFGSNRTQALVAAKELFAEGWPETGDPYPEEILFLALDADDEILSFPDKSSIPEVADAFTGINHFGPSKYPQPRVFRADAPWYWVGKTHECLTYALDTPPVIKPLVGFEYKIGTDSSRRLSGNKTSDDIALLTKELNEDPDNARAQFYLANCLWDAGLHEAAADAYARRIYLQETSPGFAEEVYLSWVRQGQCYRDLGSPDDALLCWVSAVEARPFRQEAYALLAEFHLSLENEVHARVYAHLGVNMEGKSGDDCLFLDSTCAARCNEVLRVIASKQKT